MQKNRLKVGIIGCGLRGSGVMKQILKNPDYEISAVCDTDEKALARINGEPGLERARSFSDYREILAVDEIEAVFVMVPQMLHKKMTVEAFASGKHVYCEKPMALSIEDCDEMITGGRKAGKVLMVGQQMRYHAHLNKMKGLIDSGEIGRPVMLWLKEFRDPFPGTMGWAFSKKNSGGLLVEKNCHHFDMFNWFSNSKPVSVFASGGQDVHKTLHGINSGILDNAWVTVDYESGARAMLGICMFAGSPSMKEGGIGAHIRDIGVIGDRGMLRTEGTALGRNIEVRYADSSNSVIHNISTEKNIPSAYNRSGNEGILIRFLECVREGIDPEASGEIGRSAVGVGLAAEKSAEEKRPVLLSEIVKN